MERLVRRKGIIPTVFFPRLSLLDELWIIVLWLLLSLINPWLEEGYWRGLLDAADGWPGWLAVLYGAFWFGVSPPLIADVNGAEGLPDFIGTFVVGVVWAGTSLDLLRPSSSSSGRRSPARGWRGWAWRCCRGREGTRWSNNLRAWVRPFACWRPVDQPHRQLFSA